MSIYGWGSNKFNQLCSQEVLHLYSPSLNLDVESLELAQVATGDSHTLVLTDYGDVYSFGRGKNCNRIA